MVSTRQAYGEHRDVICRHGVWWLAMFAVVDAAPAGGAAPAQVALGTAISLIVVSGIAYLGLGHRSGRVTVLRRAGNVAGPYFRARPWGAVPLLVALGAFLIAGVG